MFFSFLSKASKNANSSDKSAWLIVFFYLRPHSDSEEDESDSLSDELESSEDELSEDDSLSDELESSEDELSDELESELEESEYCSSTTKPGNLLLYDGGEGLYDGRRRRSYM